MTFWSGKKVLVTGAGGFAGSGICRSLHGKGAKITAMVTNKERSYNLRGIDATVVAGDITDEKRMSKLMEGVDVVLHSAAKIQVEVARKFPRETLETNIFGTFNVAQAAKSAGVERMVHISTCHVYGNQPEKNLPLKETAEPMPHDIYAVSKVSSELVLRPFMESGMDIVITRAFNHFGPGQTGDLLVPKTICQLLRGEVPKLGNPTPTRDYTYVSDISDGYVMCAEKGKSGSTYHLSSGKETSIGEMYEIIAESCGKSGVEAVWSDFRKNDMSRSVGDSSKARKDVGWKPKVSLKDGMRMTVDWWRKNPSIWKK